MSDGISQAQQELEQLQVWMDYGLEMGLDPGSNAMRYCHGEINRLKWKLRIIDPSLVSCCYCKALPGQACKTTMGWSAQKPHKARYQKAKRIREQRDRDGEWAY